MNGILTFVKKNVTTFIYGSLGLITAIVAIALIVWTVNGDKERLAEFRPAFIVTDTPLQTEYLVGQKFNCNGLSLNIGSEGNPQLIPAEDCGVNADFTSAGEKTVEITYKPDDYTTYLAEVDVTVIFVRSMEIEVYPSNIEVVDSNNIETDADFAMYATLASRPDTDAFGEVTASANGYRVKLNESMYTVSCSADGQLDNFYNLTLYCGNVSSVFSFYNAAGRSFIVTSSNDVVSYTEDNVVDGDAAMTLVVTERDGGYQTDCTGKTTGFYVYNNGSEEKIYDFNYELTDKTEMFLSKEVEESVTSDGYKAVIDGHTFIASPSLWQNAVVNGMIVDDHGFKLVINSDRRILSFDYSGELQDGETSPSLTLYVTDYDMNPLLGTGNGYSKGIYVFTDSDGNSYKISFYMGIWVWTYVPLSGTHSDVLSDASVNDYVYNPEAPGNEEDKYNSFYRGTLYSNITLYERGGGFKTLTFTAGEEQWLGALVGM